MPNDNTLEHGSFDHDYTRPGDSDPFPEPRESSLQRGQFLFQAVVLFLQLQLGLQHLFIGTDFLDKLAKLFKLQFDLVMFFLYCFDTLPGLTIVQQQSRLGTDCQAGFRFYEVEFLKVDAVEVHLEVRLAPVQVEVVQDAVGLAKHRLPSSRQRNGPVKVTAGKCPVEPRLFLAR